MSIMHKYKITPSIYTCNTIKMHEEITNLMQAGIDWIHFDVMDGHFVNNLGMGSKQLNDIKQAFPNLIVDVHMMSNNITNFLAEFKNADYITIHLNSQQSEGLHSTIKAIKKMGIKVGIVLDLNNTLEQLIPYLHEIDLITIMSIKPGFTGQVFEPTTSNKIMQIKNYLKQQNLAIKVQIDGGVRWTNIAQLIACEIDLIVVGSMMFKENDYQQVMNKINNLALEYHNLLN